MTDGLSAVLSRVSQIESLLSPGAASATSATGSVGSSSAGGTSSTSGTDFDDALGLATANGSSTGSTELGAQTVALATKYLGTPYRWGGTDPKTGLDCSGFTQLVYKQVGVDLPRTSAAQAQTGTPVDSLSQAQPGDLLFFGSPVHHVGIYVGDGKMIDAPHTGDKVKIQSVYETPSQIRRVLPTGSSGISGQSLSASALSSALSSGLSDSDLSSVLAGLTGTGSATAATAATASSGGLGSTPYAALFTAAGQRYGVDPALLSAVAKTESGYNATAVSPAGATGLMQLMPATARSLGVNALDPAQAVDGAARILSNNLRSFNGRVDLALAAYNAGPAAVRKYNGVPPYQETQNYVQKVQTNWGQLR
jgi:cell wall-associated NlpC family hydrolase